MSVRAYKIKKIETENSPTFNLWHDDLITDAIPSISEGLNSDGCGIIYITLDEAKIAADSIQDMLNDEGLSKEQSDNFEEQLKNALELVEACMNEDESAEFYCY